MPRRIPSLQSLACFEAAARHQSYTRAADELALTQGAISRRIAALESFLGVSLFRRTRHGVLLTGAGQAYARQIGTRLDGLERDTLDAMARQSSGGAIQLATVPTFGTRWLLPRLPRFLGQHPDVIVHLETRTRPFLFADTACDAAIYAGTPEQVHNWPGTQATLLFQEDIAPLASPSVLRARRRWRPSDLAGLPLLQQSTRPQAWRQWFETRGVSTDVALSGPRYELFSMLSMAAVHGLGVALIPPMLAQRELDSGELEVACAGVQSSGYAYYLITPASDADAPAVSALRDWLCSEASSLGP